MREVPESAASAEAVLNFVLDVPSETAVFEGDDGCTSSEAEFVTLESISIAQRMRTRLTSRPTTFLFRQNIFDDVLQGSARAT